MRNGLVIVSMTVVALALGIGLHLQFALAFWLAVVAALSVYVALLSTHILVRRSERIDSLQREVARLEARAGKPGTTPDGYIVPSGPGAYQPPRAAAVSPGNDAVPNSQAPTTDYWNFAPSKTAAAEQRSSVEAQGAGDTAAAEVATRQRDEDAEKINAVIKKLAADLTQGQAALERTHELERASASGASIAKTELVSAAALVPLPEIDRVAAAEL
ncbi:MAG: hypothetical protein ABL904_26280, partial [Hyphomicrobiaceae bacterium]